MSNNIVYTNVDQQIEKLKKQGLTINNEKFAENELRLYGYSNLIKSYRDPYTYTENGKIIYRSGITFEQIWSLYMLDKNLRNAVMACMLDLEEHIKEAAADVLAESFGVDQNSYLQFKNLVTKRKEKANLDYLQCSIRCKKFCTQLKTQYFTICKNMALSHLGFYSKVSSLVTL